MQPKPADAVDLRHLDRYTGGSRVVNEEILALFENQCHDMLARLEELAGGADPNAWRMVTHSLKGAARGVGAFGLANEAAQAEAVGPSDRGAIEALQRVQGQVRSCLHLHREGLEKPGPEAHNRLGSARVRRRCAAGYFYI